MVTFLKLICSVNVKARQNVPSAARVAAGAFGFLTLIQVFDGPERYGASSLFETIPSSPSCRRQHTIYRLDRASLRWRGIRRFEGTIKVVTASSCLAKGRGKPYSDVESGAPDTEQIASVHRHGGS